MSAMILQDSNGQLWRVDATIDGAVQLTPITSGTPSNTIVTDAISTYTGSDLYKMTTNRLAGYKNAVRADVLMDFINEGKDEIWMLLKEQNEEYFVTSTQIDDTSARNYFGALSPAAREYALPSDFRGVKFIEVLSSGYEFVKFTYRKLSDPAFRGQRKAATADGMTQGFSDYLYTLVNGTTLVLANYPETALQLRIWYVKSLPDLEMADHISGILDPFVKKIAEYAVKRVVLGLQDTKLWEAWKAEWKESVVTLMTSSGSENQADPVFVQDFEG